MSLYNSRDHSIQAPLWTCPMSCQSWIRWPKSSQDLRGLERSLYRCSQFISELSCWILLPRLFANQNVYCLFRRICINRELSSRLGPRMIRIKSWQRSRSFGPGTESRGNLCSNSLGGSEARLIRDLEGNLYCALFPFNQAPVVQSPVNFTQWKQRWTSDLSAG